MPLRRADAADVHLLTEQQLALHDDDLFDDRHDRQVAFLPHGRDGLDKASNRHVLYINALMGKRLFDLMIAAARDGCHANERRFDSPARHGDVLRVQGNDEISVS